MSDVQVISGRLVFDYINESRRGLWSTNSTLSQAIQIASLQETSLINASPDGSHLLIAPIDSGGRPAEMLSADGETKLNFTWPTAWPSIADMKWIDSQHLSYYDGANIYVLRPDVPSTTLEIKLPNLPDLLQQPGSYIEVNSLLTNLAYPTQGFGLAIRQLQGSQATTTFHFHLSQSPAAFKWSPNGEQLAVMAADATEAGRRSQELYILDQDGNGTRVSDLSAYFIKFEPVSMDWSHDGHYIAIWAKSVSPDEVTPDDNFRLYVFDIIKGVVIDYCLTNSITQGATYFGSTWSPGNSQLYIHMHNNEPALILDVSTGNITELPLGTNIVAWSSN